MLTVVSAGAAHGNGRADLNTYLLSQASEKLPSYIIDCANCADPHRMFGLGIDIPQMEQIFVTEVEMLYKFRDTLRAAPAFIIEKGIRKVVITTTGHLFNYQDELENYYITEHAWEMICNISEQIDVVAGVSNGSLHYNIAGRMLKKKQHENSSFGSWMVLN